MVSRTLTHTHLVLFFTRNVSLRTWDQVGMLEREVALYHALRPCLRDITFITYGDARDLRYHQQLERIRIACNRRRLPARYYAHLVPLLHARYLLRADVLKTNQSRGAEIALRAKRLFRKPLIVRCGYMWSMLARNRKVGKQESEIQQATALEHRVFSHADCIVVTTERMKHYVVAEHGLSPGKVRVIPNYVLTKQFKPLGDDHKPARRICFIGRLSHEKNPLVLLQAIKGLNVELVMIGDGPLRARLEAEARRDGLCVRFLGNRPHHELPQLLNDASLFVLPSPHEGHPKALLEAMSCGLPVIGTDVPGIQDVIEHRQTGLLCGTSAAEIRAAIQEVLGSADLRIHMGRNAREFVVENFALERIVEIELDLLHELIK